MKWVAEVCSCTSSPAWVWRVPLVIVPRRLTVAPARATGGFIASMVIERPPVLACAAGLACTATGRASPAGPERAAAIAAATASRGLRDRVRPRFAV